VASVPEFGAYRVLTEVVATLRGLQHHERTPADPRLLMAVLRALAALMTIHRDLLLLLTHHTRGTQRPACPNLDDSLRQAVWQLRSARTLLATESPDPLRDRVLEATRRALVELESIASGPPAESG
jgi:hypothetical protein